MTRGDNRNLAVSKDKNREERQFGGESYLASMFGFGEEENRRQDARSDQIVMLIRERLERHPHFRGRASQFQIEMIGGAIVLSGRLPTYYLKQLLQEAVKDIPDVTHIDNRVEVTFH